MKYTFYVCNQVLQRHAAAEISNVIFGTLSCAVCYLTKPSSVKLDAGRRHRTNGLSPQRHESLSCDRPASRSEETLNRTDPSLVCRQLSPCLLQSPSKTPTDRSSSAQSDVCSTLPHSNAASQSKLQLFYQTRSVLSRC